MGKRRNSKNYKEELKQAKIKHQQELEKHRMERISRIGDDSDADIFVVRLNRVIDEFIYNNETSMSRISEDCGFGRDLVASYIRGGRLPNSITLFKLCRYLNVSADWLLGLSNEKKAVW